MKIWLVLIETEDTEKYYYVFSKKPKVSEVKKLFFASNGETYDKEDWGVCIEHKIIELEVH